MMRAMRTCVLPLACVVLLSSMAIPAHAQVGTARPDEVAALRAELAQLRAEVAEMRAVVQAMRTGAAPPAQAPAPAEAAPADPAVSMLQSQVAELAQGKVESVSKLPVRVFGSIVSNTVANSGEANWLENPNVALRAPAGIDNPGSFTSTMRQSRIGLTVDGVKLGGWTASGLVAFDFLGGTPGFATGQVMGIPRLLYGVVRIATDATTITVGQEDAIFAPRNPTSVAAASFPALFRSGNLYMRVPQVKAARRFGKADGGHLNLAAGIAAPIAGDRETPFYEFAPLADGGERSRRPAFEGRAAWVAGDGASRRFELGASAHVSRERSGRETSDSTGVAVDLDVQFGRIGFGAEAFAGENLDAFGAAVSQEAKTRCGFAEARLGLTDRIELVGGYGLDEIDEAELLFFPITKNATGFGSISYRFSPELVGGFEYRYLTTTRRTSGDRQVHHFNWVLAYTF